MPLDRRRRRGMAARLARGGRGAGRRAGGGARQRGQPVPALARSVVRRDRRGARVGAIRDDGSCSAPGPSDRDAAARIAAARARLGAGAGRDRRPRGVRPAGAARADRTRAGCSSAATRGPLHIAAATPTPIVGLYGPTLPARSAPVARPAIAATISVEPGRPPLPAVRSARLRAGRLPVPDRAYPRTG